MKLEGRMNNVWGYGKYSTGQCFEFFLLGGAHVFKHSAKIIPHNISAPQLVKGNAVTAEV